MSLLQNNQKLDKYNEKNVGYSLNGEKLTVSKLKKEVEGGQTLIKAGQFVEHSKFVLESKNW